MYEHFVKHGKLELDLPIKSIIVQGGFGYIL